MLTVNNHLQSYFQGRLKGKELSSIVITIPDSNIKHINLQGKDYWIRTQEYLELIKVSKDLSRITMEYVAGSTSPFGKTNNTEHIDAYKMVIYGAKNRSENDQ